MTAPLRRDLREPFDDARLAAVWQRVEAGLATPAPVRWLRAALPVVALVAVSAALLSRGQRAPAPRPPAVPMVTAAAPSRPVATTATATARVAEAPPAAVTAPPTAPAARPAPAALTVDQLWARVDQARRAHAPAEADRWLRRIVEGHPTHPSAATAAFTRGRLLRASLGRPGEAARSFARAIDLGVPRSLEEDAWARVVEASVAAGDLPGAREAAHRYGVRFPGGRRSAEIARWIAPP